MAPPIGGCVADRVPEGARDAAVPGFSPQVYRPRRSDGVIESAGYERFQRQDGRGFACRFGDRKSDLVRADGKFRTRKIDGPRLSTCKDS